jgi:DNA-binding XRE family transcriptional regulator
VEGCNGLRTLRTFLSLEQREMALLAQCSRHTIEAVEQGKLKLSPRLAAQVAKTCGVNLSWLLAGDANLPMTNPDGAPYTKDDFEFAQAEEVLRSYQLEPEMKLGVVSDLLFRELTRARRDNTVPQFIKWLERTVVGPLLDRSPELKKEFYAGLRKGPGRAKDLLFPRDITPLERTKRHIVEALAEYRAWLKVIPGRSKENAKARRKVSKK